MTESGYPSAVHRPDVTRKASRLGKATRATACSAIALLIARRKGRACNPHGLRRRSSSGTRPHVVSGEAETRESSVFTASAGVTRIRHVSRTAGRQPPGARRRANRRAHSERAKTSTNLARSPTHGWELRLTTTHPPVGDVLSAEMWKRMKGVFNRHLKG